MNGRTDIKKWGKLLIMLLAAVFLLSACQPDYNETIKDPAGASAELQKVSCWQKEILVPIYDMVGLSVMEAYKSLAHGSMSVMMIAFAFWLALRLLKFVSSVTEDNPAEVWNEVIKKAFLCLLCGMLASSSGMLLMVINQLLFPIYQAFLEFGSELLDLASKEVKSVNTLQVMGETLQFQEGSISCKIAGAPVADMNGFPTNIRDGMGCMVCAVAERLSLGRDVALMAMKSGGTLSWIVGCLLWATFLVVGAGFVFYLIDSIFRFGMMIVLLPVLIMSYAFGPTRKWTGVGFTNIMNSAAFMMAFSIIISMCLMALVELISDRQDIFNPNTPLIYVQQMSVTTMCLLMVGFLVYGSMEVSQQLTGAIVGGKTDAKFQQNLKAAAGALLSIITGGLTSALNKVGFFEKTRIGRAWKSGGAFKNKLNELAGRRD